MACVQLNSLSLLDLQIHIDRVKYDAVDRITVFDIQESPRLHFTYGLGARDWDTTEYHLEHPPNMLWKDFENTLRVRPYSIGYIPFVECTTTWFPTPNESTNCLVFVVNRDQRQLVVCQLGITQRMENALEKILKHLESLIDFKFGVHTMGSYTTRHVPFPLRNGQRLLSCYILNHFMKNESLPSICPPPLELYNFARFHFVRLTSRYPPQNALLQIRAWLRQQQEDPDKAYSKMHYFFPRYEPVMRAARSQSRRPGDEGFKFRPAFENSPMYLDEFVEDSVEEEPCPYQIKKNDEDEEERHIAMLPPPSNPSHEEIAEYVAIRRSLRREDRGYFDFQAWPKEYYLHMSFNPMDLPGNNEYSIWGSEESEASYEMYSSSPAAAPSQNRAKRRLFSPEKDDAAVVLAKRLAIDAGKSPTAVSEYSPLPGFCTPKRVSKVDDDNDDDDIQIIKDFGMPKH